MGFFSSLKKFVDRANSNVNKVMKVVDPVGGYLKEYTETNSQKDLMKMMGLGGSQSYDDLGGTQKAVADETSVGADKTRRLKDRQRRQGPGGGATLLSTDESQRLEKSTLLGM